jgi:UMF1 family MFS transporter
VRGRKDVLAWCLFDFANSSYTTVITTVAFSVYFRDVIVGRSDPRADFLLGLSGVLVCVAVILASPVFGALADHSGRKSGGWRGPSSRPILAHGSLRAAGPGDVTLAVVLYVIATIGFEGGYVFYNAFLPEISTPENVGRISAWPGGAASWEAWLPSWPASPS